MAELTISKPAGIALASEASVGHKIINKPAQVNPTTPALGAARPAAIGQRRAGQYGAAPGVQINQRGPAPISKIPPQSISIMRSTLGTLRKFCEASSSQSGVHAIDNVLSLIAHVERGLNIADQPPYTPPAPTTPPAPAAPAVAHAPAPVQPIAPPPATPTAQVAAPSTAPHVVPAPTPTPASTK